MKLALTYDDGPNPAATGLLLELLRKHNAPATFFMVGKWVKECPEMAKRVFKAGHTIGNHTFTHPKLTEIPSNDAMSEIDLCSVQIHSAIGSAPKWFRPPFILHNSEIEGMALRMGMPMVLYDAAAGDGGEPKLSYQIEEKIVSELKGDGIILMHDGSHETLGANRYPTIKATELLLQRYKGRAQFVSLEQFYAA